MWYAVRRASAHIIVLSSYSPFGNILFKLFFCFAIHMKFSGCKKFKVICVLHLVTFIYISKVPLVLVKSESLNAVK